MKPQVEIYDATLHDGSQGETTISFSLRFKTSSQIRRRESGGHS
jgi:hypothetical protein